MNIEKRNWAITYVKRKLLINAFVTSSPLQEQHQAGASQTEMKTLYRYTAYSKDIE